MREATKTYHLYSTILDQFLVDPILDIGCGEDKIKKSAVGFDLDHGDAEKIDLYLDGTFNTVFSSHCLEHMSNPVDALRRWSKLVSLGGHLVCIVPDEDLYEQGVFPSARNDDHKATFTISKSKSWSPESINVLDLVNSLPDFELIYLKLQDDNYDRRLISWGRTPSNFKFYLTLLDYTKNHFPRIFDALLSNNYYARDQLKKDGVLAQIMFILRRIK